jgi:hypothetical protein
VVTAPKHAATLVPLTCAHWLLACAHSGAPEGGAFMSKQTPMDREAADRIRAAADNDPDSPTARSEFPDRADQAVIRNEEMQQEEE